MIAALCNIFIINPIIDLSFNESLIDKTAKTLFATNSSESKKILVAQLIDKNQQCQTFSQLIEYMKNDPEIAASQICYKNSFTNYFSNNPLDHLGQKIITDLDPLQSTYLETPLNELDQENLKELINIDMDRNPYRVKIDGIIIDVDQSLLSFFQLNSLLPENLIFSALASRTQSFDNKMRDDIQSFFDVPLIIIADENAPQLIVFHFKKEKLQLKTIKTFNVKEGFFSPKDPLPQVLGQIIAVRKMSLSYKDNQFSPEIRSYKKVK